MKKKWRNWRWNKKTKLRRNRGINYRRNIEEQRKEEIEPNNEEKKPNKQWRNRINIKENDKERRKKQSEEKTESILKKTIKKK